MLRQIKRLGAETAVYGVGTVAGRFLNFLLVPFYTNVLLPAEYGVVAYLYSLIAFANVLYWYGMESAFFRFASGDGGGGGKEGGAAPAPRPPGVSGAAAPRAGAAVFSTPLIAMAATSLVLSGILFLVRDAAAEAIGLRPGDGALVGYTAGILFLDAVAVVPFAYLRLARMAKLFAWIKFLNVLANVLLNVVLLTRHGMGVEGIFLSGLLASALSVLLLVPVVAGEFRAAFDGRLLAAMLRFSLPTVPAGLALMALQVIDRPILKALTDDATVGIYQANYRLGIFMMIAVSIYEYAWRPFFFSHASDPDAKRLFARIMTYAALALTGLFIAFTLFVPEVARWEIAGRHFIHPRYWQGLGIVPVVMLGYLFLGISTNLSAGIYIEKKTKYLPAVNVTGAAVNIGLNYLLIPRLGITGAAWATLLAYAAMAGLMYAAARRVYPVQYEWARIAKLAGVAGGVLFVSLFLPAGPSAASIASKVLLLLSFPVILLLLNLFDASELSAARRLLWFGRPGGRG